MIPVDPGHAPMLLVRLRCLFTRPTPKCLSHAQLAQTFMPGGPRVSSKTTGEPRPHYIMGLTLRLRIVTTLLLITCLGVNGVSWSPRQLRVETGRSRRVCPPCELLFSKLEDTGRNGKLSQFVTVQERGEPKSGTGLVYFWAIASFMKTCKYLGNLYGEETALRIPMPLCYKSKPRGLMQPSLRCS